MTLALREDQNWAETINSPDELVAFLTEKFEALEKGEITLDEFPVLRGVSHLSEIVAKPGALKQLSTAPQHVYRMAVAQLFITHKDISKHPKAAEILVNDQFTHAITLTSALEEYIKDGEIKNPVEVCKVINALLETTDEESVFTTVCFMVRMITSAQKTRVRSLLGKWDETKAQQIVGTIAKTLRSETLVPFYEKNFKHVSSEQLASNSPNATSKIKDLSLLNGLAKVTTLNELDTWGLAMTPALRLHFVRNFLLPGLKTSTDVMRPKWIDALTTKLFKDISKIEDVTYLEDAAAEIRATHPAVADVFVKNFAAQLARVFEKNPALAVQILFNGTNPRIKTAAIHECAISFANQKPILCAQTYLNIIKSGAVVYVSYDVLPEPVKGAVRTLLAEDIVNGTNKYAQAGAVLLATDPLTVETVKITASKLPKQAIEQNGEKYLWNLNREWAVSGCAPAQLGEIRAVIEPIIEAKRIADEAKKNVGKGDSNGHNTPPPIKRIKRTREQVTETLLDEPEAVPTAQLSTHELGTLLREALAAKQLPDDVLHRIVSLNGLQQDLTVAFEEVSDILTSHSWETGTERRTQIDPKSPLAALGVTEVSFVSAEEGWQTQLVFGNAQAVNGEARYCNAGLLDTFGEVDFETENTAALRNLEQLFSTEIARHFAVMCGSELIGDTLNDVRTLLGMDEYVPPPLPPKTPTAETTAALTTGEGEKKEDAPKPENPRIKNTAEFQTDNLATFEAFMAYLRDIVGLEIEESYEDVALFGYELQGRIHPNKQLPVGGVSVPPPATNPLAPYIEEIEFTGVAESRSSIEQLNIDPLFFHEKITDAYLGSATVHINKDVKTIRFCIIPGRFDVYFIGVDGNSYDEDENTAFAAFKNAILQNFYNLTMREYNSDNRKTSLGTKRKGPQGPWTEKVDHAILAASQGQFPVIVTSWGSERQSQDDETPRPRKREFDTVRTPRELFEKLYAKPLDPEVALAGHCLFLRGRDYIQIPGFAENERVLPPKAWIGKNGDRRLREGFGDVAIPLTTPEQVVTAIAHAQEPLVAVGILGEDVVEIFEADVTSGITPGNAFADCYYKYFLDSVSDDLQVRMNNYGAGDLVQTARIATLFTNVFEAAQKRNPATTAADIMRAFFGLKRMPLHNFEIPTKRARDYRLAYGPRKGGDDMPTATAFREENSALEAAAETRNKVTTIIEGNRFRISLVSQRWIVGYNRSEALDHAAEIQNEWSNDREISLAPRTRALLLWEFEDGEIAFTYLDEARDETDTATGTTVTGAERLQAFGKVREKIIKAQNENTSGIHTDFTDMQTWKLSELRRLEAEGVIKLARKGRRVTGIESAKKIARKQVVIVENEQVGYRQFATTPTTLQNYAQYIQSQGGELPCDITYDPKLAPIQDLFYKELGMIR